MESDILLLQFFNIIEHRIRQVNLIQIRTGDLFIVHADNTARHTDELDFSSLLEAVSRLLSDDGTFSVVLPAAVAADFISLAIRRKLSLKKQTWVCHKAEVLPKRVLMSFVRHAVPETEVGRLIIEASPKVYTPEFAGLVKDYYLFVTS